MVAHPTIWIEGTLTINGKEYPFAVDNDSDSGFDHDGFSSQAYNIVNDLNDLVSKMELYKSLIDDTIIEELEGVFKCDEHTEDVLVKKYDDLYKRVITILKKMQNDVRSND
ncbi:MAG: hypothetical protein CMM25_07310 [Rhodospirillaceae bacterium]|jgi:lipid II:glycine glycyltransferase (peptidoglycan interpeptide bridge formation enzyme)|nr:hypothetical protein [Rhodospirillaceae bacterium]